MCVGLDLKQQIYCKNVETLTHLSKCFSTINGEVGNFSFFSCDSYQAVYLFSCQTIINMYVLSVNIPVWSGVVLFQRHRCGFTQPIIKSLSLCQLPYRH